MSTDNLDVIAQLADEMKLCWSLLQTAVRLDRRWSANLQLQYSAAEQEALNLGRQLAGNGQHVATLAELRMLTMNRIEYLLECMTRSAGMTPDEHGPLALVRRLVADVAETGRLLMTGVDIASCRCTVMRSARRRLLERLRVEKNAKHLMDAADELTTLACLEAERLLETCVMICNAGDQRTQGAPPRMH